MEEKPEKVQRYVRVPVSDKDYNFLSVLKDSVRRSFDKGLRDRAIMLVAKLRRGVKI